MKITFKFPMHRLVWNAENGQVTTHWPDGTRSDSWLHWSDRYHGLLLGLTEGQHRLQHELAHHLVGMFSPEGEEIGGCPIVWRDAHGEEQPQPWSQDREWLITALQYHSRGLDASLDAMEPMRAWGIRPQDLSAKLASLVRQAIFYSARDEDVEILV